jgi:hypothetical protein
MNRLKHMRCYLIGGMDRASDAGVGWRRRTKAELADLEIDFFDPTRKPIDVGVEDDESRRLRHEAKMRGDYEYVVREMKPIRGVDLRMVDTSDFDICHLDLETYAFGTVEEISLANRQKKPILVHMEGGKQMAPDWLFAMIPHQLIFGTWEELYAYVRHIAHDEDIDRLRRWYFFNFHGDNTPEDQILACLRKHRCFDVRRAMRTLVPTVIKQDGVVTVEYAGTRCTIDQAVQCMVALNKVD